MEEPYAVKLMCARGFTASGLVERPRRALDDSSLQKVKARTDSERRYRLDVRNGHVEPRLSRLLQLALPLLHILHLA